MNSMVVPSDTQASEQTVAVHVEAAPGTGIDGTIILYTYYKPISSWEASTEIA